MSASYRHSTYLPWYTASADERRFQIIALVVLIIALLSGTLVPMIELPEKERFKKQTLPPRLARLILEQKKEPPKPKKIVKKKLPEPEKKKPEKKKLEEKKKPEPQKPPEKQVAKKKPTKEDARKKAASAGLLAFADQLADLREEQIESSVKGVQKLSTTGKKTYRSQRSIISSGVASGSGGINTAALSSETGGAGLSGRRTTEVQSSAISEETKAAARGKGKGKNFKGNRTREEIQVVFDQNKGAVYALYNRALRKDPTLRGKVVLELTITPAGKVTRCVILSSELNDKKLERKLVSRIKLFKFPAKDVDTAVVSYPIDFLPS
ncbi:MAG: TonB family protein [Candidatus Thiodiazotropha sp. (ex Lucina aurantia)]|nr:TonB family protein [Candidatus Thiodiazotropha sp. (ex Lucina pensylvanica)]MBT3022894.1 TonB family protein [Candidatus Thiodiazotropha taylori]MBV2099686.1 TonB family protein [Candidatus Thiodiazotropha sp. (ex Codakia orbicularis)]MBV2102776.1 TonB family protein [Candidatus Thiodiazotropha sp. (ex Lucina aurantia)]MBV2117347.1 TonB family protein [Candidatus Thiodiazotropha sp. (ex Lucina aurantia)]